MRGLAHGARRQLDQVKETVAQEGTVTELVRIVRKSDSTSTSSRRSAFAVLLDERNMKKMREERIEELTNRHSKDADEIVTFAKQIDARLDQGM